MGLEVVDPQVQVRAVAKRVAQVRVRPEQCTQVVRTEIDPQEIVLATPGRRGCQGNIPGRLSVNPPGSGNLVDNRVLARFVLKYTLTTGFQSPRGHEIVEG